MPISDLHQLIIRNLEQMGYARPRPIQEAARGPILAGRDVIGLAQTGTGKTAAFAAPLLHLLLSRKPGEGERPIRPAERLRAIVLCPTRELAQQVQKEAGVIAQGTALRTVCVFGKAAIAPQAQVIERGVDLLVGTPGRVIELLDDGRLSLAHVVHAVIDEGDRMLDMGFLPQVRKILERVSGAGSAIDKGDSPRDRRSRGCQIMLFSATMPPAMEDLARTFMHDPQRLEIGKHTTPVSHVTQRLIPVDDRHKVEALLHLMGVGGTPALRAGSIEIRKTHRSAAHRTPGSESRGTRTGVLIFCRTRRRVGWVGAALERHGIKVGMLHGDRSQAQRQRALDRFKAGELDALVATDVAARGLHVAAVRTVVNYDLPVQPEEYVHRIGRAAHGAIDEPAMTDAIFGAVSGAVSDAPASIESDDSQSTTFSHSQECENVPPAARMSKSPASATRRTPRGEAFTLLDGEDRLAWRAIVDTTGIEVFAEHEINGWSPPEAKPARRGKADAQPRGEDRAKSDSAKSETDHKPRRDQRRETRRRKGRSHASAPIRKGQKPGGGVKRRA